MTHAISPFQAGLTGRCVTCGRGKVFDAYLKLKDRCEVCGQDFSHANTGDGPAFFIGFAALIVFAPFGFVIPLMGMPVWATAFFMALVVGIATMFCLLLLPVGKATLLALQVKHQAEEARLDETG